MNRVRRQHSPAGSLRRGFTLVEMLVSVALVLLMMTMFTSIFSMATNSVSKQRSISENDQRARTLTTIIRADFAKRTNRYPFPYYPGELNSTSPTPFGNRAGYIYISTNDPYSGLDDIIQFTVNADNLVENTDQSPYFGASKLLYDALAEALNEDRRTTIRFNPNQPEADDGQIFTNGVASSRAAEISLFVRNGDLIRRVSLLRDPLPIAGQDYSVEPRSTGQPGPPPIGDHPYFIDESDPDLGLGAGNGGHFYFVGNPGAIDQINPGDPDYFFLPAGTSPPTSWNVIPINDFWRHFDFSGIPVNFTLNLPTNVQFIGVDSLDNSTLGGGTTPLGNPRFRFGFNPVTGCSREHDNALTAQFIGRYVQAETSFIDFNYPIAPSRFESTGGGLIGNGNPMDVAGTPLNLNPSVGLVEQYRDATGNGRGGARRVEDLLLTNVHDLKVEIWDDRLGRFVTPGYGDLTSAIATGNVGDYHIRRSLQVHGTGSNAGRVQLWTAVRRFGVPAANRQLPHIFDTGTAA
ncbi:MAG: type II secretion system protein [Planctomycetaceae bacterium]